MLWRRALFMNRWIPLYSAIILRILTDPEFNEICIFGSGVKAEMRHVSYGILSRVIFSHNENCDWILRQIWCAVFIYRVISGVITIMMLMTMTIKEMIRTWKFMPIKRVCFNISFWNLCLYKIKTNKTNKINRFQ